MNPRSGVSNGGLSPHVRQIATVEKSNQRSQQEGSAGLGMSRATPRSTPSAPPQKRYEWPNKTGIKIGDRFKPVSGADREGMSSALSTRDYDYQVVGNAVDTSKATEPVNYEACLELILMIGFKDGRKIGDASVLKEDIQFRYNQELGSHHPALDLNMVSEPDGRWHMVKTKGEFFSPPSETSKTI